MSPLTLLSRIILILLIICAAYQFIVLLFGVKYGFNVIFLLGVVLLFSFLGKKLDESGDDNSKPSSEDFYANNEEEEEEKLW